MTEAVVVKPVPQLRVAEVTDVAASYSGRDIGPVISPLYPRLMGALDAAGVRPVGPAIAYYEPVEGGQVVVHAAVEVEATATAGEGFVVRDLPAVAQAAAIVHHGPMSEVMPTMEALTSWVAAHGYYPLAWAREVYLDYSPEDAANGVTELQLPVAAS